MNGTITDYVHTTPAFNIIWHHQQNAHTVNIRNRQRGPANHNYDSTTSSRRSGSYPPAVSFIKAPSFQDAHQGNSDPLDEQTLDVQVINTLQRSEFCDSTAVVITYDDSDGWYDHVMPPVVNQSLSTADALTGAGACGDGTTTALPGGAPPT